MQKYQTTNKYRTSIFQILFGKMWRRNQEYRKAKYGDIQNLFMELQTISTQEVNVDKSEEELAENNEFLRTQLMHEGFQETTGGEYKSDQYINIWDEFFRK
eukprot:UN10524